MIESGGDWGVLISIISFKGYSRFLYLVVVVIERV